MPDTRSPWAAALINPLNIAMLGLAVGAGAIFQVVGEVSLLLLRRARAQGGSVATIPATAGLLAGIVVMYGTALLVQA